jgi:serine/alanine adding enzyme
VTIDEVAPEGWDELLEEIGCTDAYLQHAYVEASCLLDGGRPALLHAGGTGGHVVFACSVRPVPDAEALHDVTTPYGYGGPVAVGPAPPLEDFWALYEAWCAQHGVVTTFLRFHPLFENHRYAAPSVWLEPLADTIAWPLDGEGDLFEAMHRHHRRVVRKAEGQVEVSVHEPPSTLAELAGLYESSMRLREAAAFYFFPPAYWEALVEGLGGSLVLFEAHDDHGLVAATLCLATRPWLHYHLGATSERARRVGAAALLMLSAARWGRERGFSVFHLGGGVGGREDSLWEYKRRFAPAGRLEMRIGKAVHDAHAYQALTGPGTLGPGGFFPAYRERPSASVRGARA